jgi:monoamine oxidase
MPLSRRRLIHLVGRAGGVAAAYRTMAAMGLLPVPSAYAGPPAMPPGEGRRIIIIGAGIAGMVLAFELGRAGYDCLVLEARDRPGGRNWSLRDGDTVEEAESIQSVHWDRAVHLYFNPGPARLPHNHQGILAYCRTLGVELEVMCNDNRAALMQDDKVFDGKPQRNRAVVNDSRGYVAELAAKAVNHDLMDEPVSLEDKERIRSFLREFGALDNDLAYHGSSRSGYVIPPSAGDQRGEIRQPLDLRALVHSDFWDGPGQFGEFFSQSATMMQPVGGMGRIGEAFGRVLERLIIYRAQVVQMRRTSTGARVFWRDGKTGDTRSTEAPLVVCTIPFSVLRYIDVDFAPQIRQATATVEYMPALKLAFQAERRFWEIDEQIYGGISWTSRDITQVWYPSAGIHQQKGILVGAYIWSADIGDAYAAKIPPQRLVDAIADGERLHANYGQFLTNGVSVAWKNIPFSRGAWAEWAEGTRATAYPTLLKGDGPYLFCGEHMSWLNGWQEGAVRSAHHVMGDLAQRFGR